MATLRDDLAAVPAWHDNPGKFLDEQAKHTGILAAHDGDEWAFWHKSFREALAAEYLYEEWKRDSRRLLAKAKKVVGDEGMWAEPYALLTSRLPNPDQWIKELASVNPRLGLRALATASTVSPHTLKDLVRLAEHRGDWISRAEIYFRIAPFLGGEGAVDMLWRIRLETRNGNDLFFLREAMAMVALHYPDASALARSRIADFYSHLVDSQPAAGVSWISVVIRPRGSPDPLGCIEAASLPVTVAEYAMFDPTHPLCRHPTDAVMTNITWFEAAEFIRWCNADLPATSEWQYLAPTSTRQPYDHQRHHDEGPALVGQGQPNGVGLYDTDGIGFWSTNNHQMVPDGPVDVRTFIESRTADYWSPEWPAGGFRWPGETSDKIGIRLVRRPRCEG